MNGPRRPLRSAPDDGGGARSAKRVGCPEFLRILGRQCVAGVWLTRAVGAIGRIKTKSHGARIAPPWGSHPQGLGGGFHPLACQGLHLRARRRLQPLQLLAAFRPRACHRVGSTGALCRRFPPHSMIGPARFNRNVRSPIPSGPQARRDRATGPIRSRHHNTTRPGITDFHPSALNRHAAMTALWANRVHRENS